MKKTIIEKPTAQLPIPETLALGSASLMEIIRHGATSLLKTAIEHEITAHLGRARYAHSDTEGGATAYRNGYREARIDTPSGAIVYDRQRLAGDPDFKSKIHRPHMRRPEEFDAAVAEMYVSGVSTRKVKKALCAVAGDDLRMSRSTVSRITERLRAEFREWKKRDLSELKAAYVFVDAIRIGLGNEESSDVWGKFIADLKLRGLKDPILVVSDGNPGVIGAIERYFPTADRQRCVKHKVDNVMDSIPKEKYAEVRPKLNRIFFGSTSLEQAKTALEKFVREYRKIYPQAVSRLLNDVDQALTFYLFESAHWRRIRASNKLERMNLEIRRRLNVIGRHPSEEGCLALVYQTTKRHAERQKAFDGPRLSPAHRSVRQYFRTGLGDWNHFG